MQIVDLRVFEVCSRSYCHGRRVHIVWQSRRHFRFYSPNRRIDILCQNKEVIGCTALNLLHSDGQMVFHVVIANTRVFISNELQITVSSRFITGVNMSLLSDLA